MTSFIELRIPNLCPETKPRFSPLIPTHNPRKRNMASSSSSVPPTSPPPAITNLRKSPHHQPYKQDLYIKCILYLLPPYPGDPRQAALDILTVNVAWKQAQKELKQTFLANTTCKKCAANGERNHFTYSPFYQCAMMNAGKAWEDIVMIQLQKEDSKNNQE
jgi:hypothetical protein